MHNESLPRRRIASMPSLCPRAFATAKHLFIIGWTNGYVKLGLVCGVPRLRRGQGHFDCPCNLRVSLAGGFMCGAAHSRCGTGDAPAGAPKGFPLALWKPSGAPCRWLFVRCGAQPLGRVSRLRARARAFRSPLQPSGVAFLGGVGMASRARSTGKSSAATARGGVVLC